MAVDFQRVRPNENRRFEFVELPDGRKRLTRYFDIADAERPGDALVEAYGTVDTGLASGGTAGFASLRLVNQELRRDDSKRGNESVYVKIYEELPASAEQQVGSNTVIKLEDGRTGVEANFLQFSSASATPGTVGASTAPGDASAYLQKEEAENDGALRRIKRTYVYEGTISTDDESLSGGKLLKKTIVSVKTVPATPVGFTLVGTPVQSPNGLPVYSYTFAKGAGRVETDIGSRYNGKLTVTTIRYLDSDDGTTPGGTLIRDDTTENDGYTVYAKSYAEVIGDGLFIDGVEIRNKGKLKIYHRARLGSAPATPTATISGTVVSIGAEIRQEEGFEVYDYRWAEGKGRISERIDAMNDGTRRQTYVSLGTREAPGGVVEIDEQEDIDGVTRYNVTSRQAADGGTNVTLATMTFEDYVPFRYPGRAKAFSETYNSRKMLEVFKSPPHEVEILATVSVSYQTTSTIGSLPNTKWQPLESATVRAQWIGLDSEPSDLVEELPGFRSVSSTPVTETASGVAPNDVSIFGRIVFGGTTAKITVTGGPAAPDGNTYVLDAKVEQAFQATDGTKYYRKTIISATIPSQPALPV